MADVFLSYRNTEERRAIIARLATILRAHGLTVWWDYGLAAGASFKEQIEAELIAARIVIPVWCEESIKSDWVKREATLAKGKLLPIRLQRVQPPAGFEHLHAHHLERWTGSILDPQLDALVKEICGRIGDASELSPDTKAELSQLPSIKPLTPPPRAQRRWLPLTAAIAAAGAVAVGVIVATQFMSPDTLILSSAPIELTETGNAPPPSNAAPAEALLETSELASLQWSLGSADSGGAGILEYRARTLASGSGVTVAMIDTGVYPYHRELLRNPALVAGLDLVTDPRMAADGDGRDREPWDPGDACSDATDRDADSQHGTINASLLIAQGEAGLVGIAPDVKLIVVRVMGRCGGRLSDITDSIKWLAGSTPIQLADGSMTEGAPVKPDILVLPIALLGVCPARLEEAISQATATGMVVVASAGNTRLPSGQSAPANCPGVLRVGASTLDGRIAFYSNSDVDLLAPGGDLTKDLDGDNRPDGILGAKLSAGDCGDDPGGEMMCDYAYNQGTSVAAVIAAGALALLRSNHPDEPMADTVQRLKRATRPMDVRQCSVPCENRPGTAPIPGVPGQCYLGCGEGRIDLSLAE